MRKYSKSFKDVFKIKKNFFDENKKNLKNILKINSVYLKQSKRKKCKNCEKKILNKEYLFKSFKIEYFICEKCNHVNGKYEDSKKFCNWLYQENKGDEYKFNYLHNYDLRVKKIYIPKVEFLRKVVKKKINLVDIGCGGGHFLKALEKKNISAYGFEPSYSLSKLGNKKLKKNKIINAPLDKILNKLSHDSSSSVISFIGVLEHLRHPNKFIKFFKKSNFKYMYLTLPLFSLSSVFENNFSNTFPRVLGGGHTHLYTKESINYLIKKNKLKIVGEWWFGSDVLDIYRSLVVNSKSSNYEMFLKKNFYQLLDKLQEIIDKQHQCNEVQLILKK